MMNAGKIPWLFVVVSLIVGAGCSSTTTKRTHPDLLAPRETVRKIALMPPRIYIERVTMKGMADPYDIIADLEDAALETARKIVPRFGFVLVPARTSYEDLLRDTQAMYDLADIQDRVSRLDLEVYQVRTTSMEAGVELVDERITEGKLRIGLEVIPFAEEAGADLLCFLQGYGVILTGKKKAVNLASGVLSGAAAETGSGFGYRCLIVDGSDGKVLTAFTGGFSLNYFGCDECGRGQPGYDEALKRFKRDLEEDLIEKLSRNLEREPGPAPGS